MRNDLLIGVWIIGYFFLITGTFIYFSTPETQIITISSAIRTDNTIIPYQIIPQQIHVSFDTINSAFITFTCKEKADSCTVYYLNKEIKVKQSTHILHNKSIYKVRLI